MICINCGHNNENGRTNCSWCNFPLPTTSAPAKPNEDLTPYMPSEPTLSYVPPPDAPVLEPRTARIHHDSSKPVKGKKSCPQCNYQLVLDSAFCPMCSFPIDPGRADTESIKRASELPAPHPSESLSGSLVPPPSESLSGISIPSPEPEPLQEPLPSLIESIPDEPAVPTLPTDIAPPPPDEMPAPQPTIKPRGKSTTSPFRKKQAGKIVSSTIDPFRKDISNELVVVLQPIPREHEAPMDPISFVASDEPVQLNRAVLEPDNNTITSKLQAMLEFRDGAWYITDGSDHETTFVRASGPVKLEKGDIILMGNRKFKFDY